MSALDTGTATLAQITARFQASPEAQTIIDPLIRLYEAALGRAPDPAGLTSWVQLADKGMSLQTIAQGFVASAEFTGDFGASIDPSAFVSSLYLNLLDRQASAAELAFYVGALGTAPTAAREADILLYFVNSPEFVQDTRAAVNGWLTNAAAGAEATTTATTVGAATYAPTLAPSYTYGYSIGADAITAAATTNSAFALDLPSSGSLTVNLPSSAAIHDASGIRLTGDANITVNYLSGGAGAGETLYLAGGGSTVVNFSGTSAAAVTGETVVGGSGPLTINATDVTMSAGESWTGGVGSATVLIANGTDNFAAGALAHIQTLALHGTTTISSTEAAGISSIGGGASLIILGDGTTGSVNLTGELSGLESLAIEADGHALNVTLGASDLAGVTSVTETTPGSITTSVAGAQALLAINPSLTYVLSDTPANIAAASAAVLDHSTNYAPSSTPTPPGPSILALTVPGDMIALAGTNGTITLSGADLASFPAGTYGTVASAVSAGVTTVTSTSSAILSAAGNAGATSFNFGTGVVSGADSVDAALKYTGFTTYIASNFGDTVTLSAAGQNVTGGSAGNATVNLAALTYTGTLAFGAAGSDTVTVTVGGDISGGTVTSGGAGVALVLSGAGAETLNTAEYTLFNVITGGAFGGDTIVFSNAGTVTAKANVGNYILSAAGNTLTLTDAADNVTGAASGNDIVDLAALTYTGTVAFGAGGSDSVHVSVGGDISGGTVTSAGAAVALVLIGAGTETLNTADYDLFNATGISGGTFGGDTIVFSNAGTVTANANVGNYILSAAGNTITLTNVADTVTGAASGNDIVDLAALTYTGTVAFGAGGSDSVRVSVGGDISGATVTSAGAAVALVLSGAGTETLNTADYDLFNATGISGGTFGGDTIVFSNAGTVTANANVGNYHLSAAGNTITLTNVADTVRGAASGNDIVNLAALTYTGIVAFGAGGSDSIHVTVGGDISGSTITTGGAAVGLVLSGAGAETLNTADYNLFNGASISGGSAGSNTIIFSNGGTVSSNADVGHYDLSASGNTITLTSATDTVTGAASGNDTVAIPQFSFAGTLAFGSSGTDVVRAPTNGDFSGLTLTSSGATLELMITGVTAGVPSGSTTTTEIYNEFTTGPHAGGIIFPAGGDTDPADYIIAFSDQGTVTDGAHITNYYLNASVHSTISDIYSFTIANNGADNITEFSAATGGSTFNIDVSTFTGSISLGSSGTDTIALAAGSDSSGGRIISSGTAADLSVRGSGTITVSSAEAALFHAAPNAVSASGTVTMDIADATSPIGLSAQENALTTVGLQAGANTVNVSVGNAGAAGFNHTISENGGGNNTFNITNGAAAILGASDASHAVTIDNFNTASDTIALTLSGNAQNAGEQNITDSGNDTITIGVNGVLIEENLGALPGFTIFNATDLASARANMLRAINASASITGEYTFVIDSNQGAAIYEIHVNSGGGTIDGIQLIGVVHGVGAFNLVNHVD